MATKYKYDKDTDYAALMEQAARRGDNAAAAVYEQQRNAKIRGEGMAGQEQTSDYAQYLPIEDVPDYDDTHRREAEALLTGRGTADRREQIDRMLDALLGEQFDYDPASDKLYAAYRQQYERQAELAAENALGKAAALTDMKLPGTVTSVGHNAFTGCKALKDVRCYGAPPTVQPGGAAEHSFEPGIVTIHYNPDPVYGWTFDADGTWQGYKVSSKGACLHTGYGTTKNTVPATCGADGRIDTICANCGDVIATEVIPATGAHTWDNGTVTTEPTETTPGVRTFTCAVCSQTKTEVIPATGAHTFVFTKNVAPSCTEAGYDLYTCRDCGASEQRNVKPALGHKWDSGTVTTEPTEKDPGTMTYTCTVCGATKTEVIPATGPHTHVWDEGTVTVAPTETTPGVRTYTCTVCGQTRTEIIPATGSAVCPGGAACPSFRFRDVPAPSNWAHEGIDYCVRHGLMSGFDATTFSPDTVSTRAQIVMILYNLSGDTTDYSKYYVPFTDVRPSTWYYNAVAWGYDKDIVAGMSTTTFAPDGLITREQMAVLLYGYTEKYAPAYLGGAASLNGFPDAASVSNWAYAAMSWAVGNGLISGIASNGADYLAPSGGATRAQIAAIMMRYCRLTGL